MSTLLLGAVVGLQGVIAILVFVVLRRVADRDLSQRLVTRLEGLERCQERGERVFRDEIAKNRDEAAGHAKHLREEVAASVKAAGDSLITSVGEISNVQK